MYNARATRHEWRSQNHRDTSSLHLHPVEPFPLLDPHIMLNPSLWPMVMLRVGSILNDGGVRDCTLNSFFSSHVAINGLSSVRGNRVVVMLSWDLLRAEKNPE